MKDELIIGLDEFVVEIKNIELYQFRSRLDSKSYIIGKIKRAIHTKLTDDFRKLINTDTE